MSKFLKWANSWIEYLEYTSTFWGFIIFFIKAMLIGSVIVTLSGIFIFIIYLICTTI